MDSALLELQKDLAEVKQFLEKATRKRVRDALFVEQRKLETEISNKQQQAGESMEVQKPSAIVPPMSSTYTVKISNYGWDQSDKFVKIYITLKDVQNIPVDNVQVNFGERSFELFVKDLNGKNHTMTINNLLKPITPENSSRKVKTDTVLLMLKKKSESKWEYLTQVEKQTKEKDKPSLDTDADPSAGLMNVLKKMYDEGDDEMKRTLNKAWVESQEKQKMGGDMDI